MSSQIQSFFKTCHIFLPKSLNLFKSLGITNLNWFEIFDRGRRCDLNMKNWLKCDVLNPNPNICSSLCAKLFWYINAHIEGEQMIYEKGSFHLTRSRLRLNSWIDDTPLSQIERTSPGRVITSSWFNQWCKRVSKRTSLSRMYRFEKPWVNLIGLGNNFKLV